MSDDEEQPQRPETDRRQKLAIQRAAERYQKVRCRMHGGAKGSGAPKGSRNGRYRHGLRTQEAQAEMRRVREIMAEWREMSKLLPV